MSWIFGWRLAHMANRFANRQLRNSWVKQKTDAYYPISFDPQGSTDLFLV